MIRADPIGRTFADKDHPTRWYVYLKIDGAYTFVWWEEGKSRTVDPNKVRVEAYAFPMNQLLHRWGLTAAELDAFLEQHWYRWDDEVRDVRAKRKPLNGRTIEHLRHRHRLAPVVGGSCHHGG